MTSSAASPSRLPTTRPRRCALRYGRSWSTTEIATRGSRSTFRALRDPGWVKKTTRPSSMPTHTGTLCGEPSGSSVATCPKFRPASRPRTSSGMSTGLACHVQRACGLAACGEARRLPPARAADVLACVEPLVCRAVERERVEPVLRMHGPPEGDAEPRSGQYALEPRGQARRLLRAAERGEHGELVSADARELVRGLQRIGEHSAEAAEGVVARVLAVAIVQLLEPVHVAEQQRERAAALEAAGDRGLERARVREPRQVVALGEDLQLLDELLVGGGEPAEERTRAGEDDQPDARAGGEQLRG